MHFAEAEERYRELEENLIRGKLSEDDFLIQIAELRVVDDSGRRWMLSGRSGRWLVHDGQQWVFAEPPKEGSGIAPTTEAVPQPSVRVETKAVSETEDLSAAAVAPVARPDSPPSRPPAPQPIAPRLLAVGIALIVLLGCLIGGGIAGWVLVVRDLGEPATMPTEGVIVSVRETYTPRPATPTYTPTFTPTPSRTPTPTKTPIPTDTPIATATPLPTNTAIPTPTRTPAPATPTRQPTAVTPTVVAAVSPRPSSTATPGEAGSQTYTVEAGDTLFEIAARFGLTAQELAEANGITNTTLIRPGQELVIPVSGTATPSSAQTYTVKAGDTLSEIAIRFGVSTTALAQANGITDPTLIRPGQVLVIPVPGITPTTPTPTPTWTPLVLTTRTTTMTPTSRATSTPGTRTPTPTPTSSGPTATPRPTDTPRPTSTPTAAPVTLAGKIAYTVWNPYIGKYELYVSRIDGTGRNMLGEGFRQPQFRQDGNLLAVNGDGAANFETLVTMNPSGGDKLGVSNNAEDSFPTWSADGAIVAYSSSSWGDGKVRLGIVHDMFGRQQAWIPIGNLQVEGVCPFWLADGRIVYNGCDSIGGGGNCGLYWVGAGGGNYHRVSTHQSDTAPAGSGTRVAFMSARDGNWEVYLVDIGVGTEKRLTNNGAQDGLPTWSPDGKSIAFVSNRGGAWAIWVMDADGGNQRKLFDLDGGYGTGAYDWVYERISWAP